MIARRIKDSRRQGNRWRETDRCARDVQIVNGIVRDELYGRIIKFN